MAHKFVCIQDFENHALNNLTPNVRDFYKGGAGDEDTLKLNRSAFKKLRIRIRVLRDVSKRDISTTVLGEKISMPLGVSPTSMQRMAHPDGECANVKAVEAAKTVFILSAMSTSSIEEVAQAAPQAIKWFQLYLYFDRSITLDLIRRAEKAGFKALVLTVDMPILGDRRLDVKNEFALPRHLKFANFDGELSKTLNNSGDGSNLNKYVNNFLDDSLSWNDVDWLKSVTKLPIVLKGILTAEDAVIGVQHGASAILVSNHGARQIDGVPASVFFGRPMLWGLACAGEKGARAVLEIMRREIDQTFALAGCTNVQQVTKEMKENCIIKCVVSYSDEALDEIKKRP